jgi:hypothetical protein
MAKFDIDVGQEGFLTYTMELNEDNVEVQARFSPMGLAVRVRIEEEWTPSLMSDEVDRLHNFLGAMIAQRDLMRKAKN